jgi:PAS domain S-box-containing protein
LDRGADADDLAAAVDATRREPGLSAAVHGALEGSADPVRMLRRAVDALVPSYADACEVDVRNDSEVVRIVAAVDPKWARRRELAPLATEDAAQPIAAVLGGGPARLLDLSAPGDEPLFGAPDDPSSVRSLGVTTAMVAPVLARGSTVGSLAVGRGPSGRRFEPADLPVAVDLGRRLGLAWHNAVLLAERASILASLHDGLAVTDAAGVVLEVNQRWVEMTGFEASACVGAGMPYPWWPSADEHPEALAEAGAGAAEALATGRVEQRVVLKRADGSFFPALVSVSPVVDGTSSERRGFVVSIKDVTGWEAARGDLLALQRTTAALAGARSRRDVAEVVLDEAMARVGADAGLVLLLAGDGRHLEVVGHRGLSPDEVEAWSEVPIDRATPSVYAARDGRLVTIPDAETLSATFPGLAEWWAASGIAAAAAVPVMRAGRVEGTLTLSWRSPRVLAPTERSLLEAIAGQCGHALHRAEGYEAEKRTSQVLQRRLLSDVPIVDARATIVTRYRPANADLAVGGDWYDVVPLGPDRLAVVVGDVVGSGIDAAAIMGQLRSALRGIVAVEAEPVLVLESLDRLAASIDGASGATVCYADIDLAAGRARVSRAGHPPPVVVGASGGARLLDEHPDPPVGFARWPRRAVDVALGPGDALLLYTDGLVERRGTLLTDRLYVLVAAVEAARRDVLDDLVDDVLAACGEEAPRRDDIAVLAVRDEPAGAERLRTVMPARARSLAPARHELRDWLHGAGVSETRVDDLVLATSELLTNAVEHAYRSPSVVPGLVSLAAHLAGDEVVVEVRDAGSWKPQPSGTARGRGLTIARAVVGSLALHTGPSGTTAVLRAPRSDEMASYS